MEYLRGQICVYKINAADEFTGISFDPVEIDHDTNNARVVGLCLVGFSCEYLYSSFREEFWVKMASLIWQDS